MDPMSLRHLRVSEIKMNANKNECRNKNPASATFGMHQYGVGIGTKLSQVHVC